MGSQIESWDANIQHKVICLSRLGGNSVPGIAMLPNSGVFEMRLLSKRQVKEIVLYSPQHIARLEAAGQFPKRVQLGANRVGWVENEVLDWL